MTKGKLIANTIVVLIVLTIGIKIYTYIHNPVLVLRDVKAVKRYSERRQKRIKHAYIRETKGQLISDLVATGDEWNALSQDVGKSWKDFRKFFNF